MAAVKNRKRRSMEVVHSAPLPIGQRLKQARENEGLDLKAVADQLHLNQRMVAALEAEDYDHLPARVFVRGYYRNYARLLNLPEASILSEFDRHCPEGEECEGAPPSVAQGVRKEIRSSHGVVRLVTWLVVISLLTTFGLWWKGSMDKQASPEPQSPAVAESKVEPAKATESAESRTESTPPVAAVTEPAEEAVAAEPPIAEEVEPEVAEEPPGDQSVPSEAPMAQAQPGEETAQAQGSAPAPAEPRVELIFNADSWVDVRGSNGSFKLVGIRKAGEKIVLDGQPPYNMVIGNVRGVTISVNGKPYDLSPHTRRNVAKLSFNPN